MSLIDLIYAKTGLQLGPSLSGADQDAQILIAALLVVAAKSDGGISPDESLRMVELLRHKFNLSPGEALDLINRATDELSHHEELDQILGSAKAELSLAQKEDLILMLLNVISADKEKDPAEIRLLNTLMAGLDIPEKTMSNAYDRYFEH